MNTERNHIPPSVRATLWSYDMAKIDPARDKMLIIRHVLNYGTEDAVKWVRTQYTNDELVEAVSSSIASEWSPKSLNYWSIILDVHPTRRTRFS